MWRPTTFDAVIGLGTVAVAGALTVAEEQGLPELLFWVMLGVLTHVGARCAPGVSPVGSVSGPRS